METHCGTDLAGGPGILLAVDEPERGAFFPATARQALDELGRVRVTTTAALQDLGAFGKTMARVEILVSAWGFPCITADRLALAPRLRFVAHAASSLRSITGPDFWQRGIPISQAGDAMAPAVAELALTYSLALLRRVPRLDHGLRRKGGWERARKIPRARELRGARVTVVGASRTGRAYIAAVRALGAEVRVYDPYLPPGDPLAPYAADLATLLPRTDVLSIHAPGIPETHHLIDAHALALLPDGAGVVNTARASIIDLDALYDEVSSGRLDAALDVFDSEPLPAGDRWTRLPNVLVSPHVAGATRESRLRAGQIVIDEIRRHLDGRPLEHAVTPAALARMA
ncbi:phosphoglycerate dehydrogenase-like enzyme [Kribbella aluminosa]|uniref:Phosphoglycerate dehydrogenase-like enzyme n=1 Tax=Kribbella aluminosa TaxID=416017 RepID=A0ABS4UX07_9ACTN|nr:hydroxyacid dehydrogenase [Kribbella aluminosa]MBP2356161.1 phosphoglycerate dehydrogenase-like enzyme [Kribbella aluminosa]